MAVYPNGRYLTRSPGRHFGPGPGLEVYARGQGDRLNIYTQEQISKVLGSFPSGYGMRGIIPPIVAGAIASRSMDHITISGSAAGVLGLPGVASATLSITVQDMPGELVVSGTGAAILEVITGLSTLSAVLSGVASASVSTVDVTGSIKALGWMQGESIVAVTAMLIPYAVGHLIGQALPYTELSPQSLASAVWQAQAAEFEDAGTMGEKLNGAGSAGNPWTEIIESGYTAAEVMRIILAIQAGRTEIVNNGDGTARVKFKSLDGNTDRVTADMDGSERSSVTIEG
jgi:hypothetical protein